MKKEKENNVILSFILVGLFIAILVFVILLYKYVLKEIKYLNLEIREIKERVTHLIDEVSSESFVWEEAIDKYDGFIH